MNLFEFKIYDTHESQSFDVDGAINIKVISYWHSFKLTISTDDLWITSYREYVLIDDENNSTQCTKVYLSDGSYVYAVLKYDTFDKNYLAYLETIKVSSQSSDELSNP
jgi:hypothetical protein